MCQGMAPPPTARRRCDRPVTAGRSTALKGSAGATSARARPADRYQDNPSQGVSRFASQAGTQARLTVLLYQPQGGGLSPITLLSTTPCNRRARSASLHILPAESARLTAATVTRVAACRSSNSGATSYVACRIRAGHTAAVWQRGGGLGGWAARTVDASLGRIHAG